MSRTVRDVHNRQSALQRYRAERLLRKGFGELRSKVLAIVRSRLRAKGLALDRADLEACYAQAWQGLYATVLAGETVESPEAWLVLVTFRRAVDELRCASRADLGAQDDVAAVDGEIERARAGAGADSAAVVGGAACEPDMAVAFDDRVQLRSVFEAIRSRLSPRECEAASLCYLQGLSRVEAAARMGISERRMQKLMEGSGAAATGVASKVGELLAIIQAGGWCEQQSSLMRAYAFGILDPEGERHALAVAHTRQCPACRAHVAALRGLASVLPPLPFVFPVGGGRGADARAASGRGAVFRRAAARVGRGSVTRAVARLRGLLGGGWSLPVKLAVTGALLIGVGSAYFAARQSYSPAGGQVVRAAAKAAGSRSAVSVSHRHARRGAAVHASSPARVSSARRTSRPRRRPVVRGTSAEPSANEFSPERVRGKASAVLPQPVAPTPTSVPPASPGGTGEFGIE
ncbi:MAG TPA: sigma-70 family RNA polymerase sigma factor [Solirubrobacteraceae bacterium]|jgi:DNA-directed RNA polymerase specialized sigma24 family protein|nr:sigma-70 family RNA polymerase sigma factor [Solirubrobacteraceae bacterium]